MAQSRNAVFGTKGENHCRLPSQDGFTAAQKKPTQDLPFRFRADPIRVGIRMKSAEEVWSRAGERLSEPKARAVRSTGHHRFLAALGAEAKDLPISLD